MIEERGDVYLKVSYLSNIILLAVWMNTVVDEVTARSPKV